MVRHDFQFHAKNPFTAVLSFDGKLDGRTSPIFIESISDKYLVFFCHLKLPIEVEGKEVIYNIEVKAMERIFSVQANLLANLSNNTDTIFKFEAKLKIDKNEAGDLFKILNKYMISLRKMEKEEKLRQAEFQKKSGR